MDKTARFMLLTTQTQWGKMQRNSQKYRLFRLYVRVFRKKSI